MTMTLREKFDIRDGRNRYAPCPRCGATLGMGLITKTTGLAVQCAGSCDFRGPEIAVTGAWSPEDDRAAFDAWNSLSLADGECASTKEPER